MSVGFIGAGQLAFALAKGFTAAGRCCGQEGAKRERVGQLLFPRLGGEGGVCINVPHLSTVGNGSLGRFGVRQGLLSYPGWCDFCSS